MGVSSSNDTQAFAEEIFRKVERKATGTNVRLLIFLDKLNGLFSVTNLSFFKNKSLLIVLILAVIGIL